MFENVGRNAAGICSETGVAGSNTPGMSSFTSDALVPSPTMRLNISSTLSVATSGGVSGTCSTVNTTLFGSVLPNTLLTFFMNNSIEFMASVQLAP